MLLEELSNAFGPSGCEDEVRRILARALRHKVDELSTDALGNLIWQLDAKNQRTCFYYDVLNRPGR